MITFEEFTKQHIDFMTRLETAQDETRRAQQALEKLNDFQEGCVISTMDEADDYVRKGIISEGAHRWACFFFKWLKSSGFGQTAWEYRERRGHQAYAVRMHRITELRRLGGWKP